MTGRVERIQDGLVHIVADDGRRCWFEILSGADPAVGDVIQGDLSVLGDVDLHNETRGTSLCAFVRGHSM